MLAIENTGQFKGLYHVLGGKISPVDGIGPNQLNIDSLIDRVESEEINEIIFKKAPQWKEILQIITFSEK